ncbi:MAG: trypco2 family protein [Solirubrobacterales bacterium]
MARVSLTDLITQVTKELRLAADAAEDAEHVMSFKDCELELAVAVENEGGGGIRIHVLELGGRRTKTNSNTIRVRFTNLPERPIVLTAIQAEPSSPDQFPTEPSSPDQLPTE